MASNMSQWVSVAHLDGLIFLAYLAIPLQLLLLASKSVAVFDHTKITSTMSSYEVTCWKALAVSFALFITCCGLLHGIMAVSALVDCASVPDDVFSLCHLLIPCKVVTCVTSVGTCLALAYWTPSFLAWLQEIEIHRKGFIKLALTDPRTPSGQLMDSPQQWQEGDDESSRSEFQQAPESAKLTRRVKQSDDRKRAKFEDTGKLIVDVDGVVQVGSETWTSVFKQDTLGMKLLDCVLPTDHARLLDLLRNTSNHSLHCGSSHQVVLSFARSCDKTLFQVGVRAYAGQDKDTIEIHACGPTQELGLVKDNLSRLLQSQTLDSAWQASKLEQVASASACSRLYRSRSGQGHCKGKTFDLPSISEEGDHGRRFKIEPFGRYLAQQVLPRLPLKQCSWSTACAELSTIVCWLKSTEAEELAIAYQPCMGMSCSECQAGIQPDESSCKICGAKVDDL